MSRKRTPKEYTELRLNNLIGKALFDMEEQGFDFHNMSEVKSFISKNYEITVDNNSTAKTDEEKAIAYETYELFKDLYKERSKAYKPAKGRRSTKTFTPKINSGTLVIRAARNFVKEIKEILSESNNDSNNDSNSDYYE